MRMNRGNPARCIVGATRHMQMPRQSYAKMTSTTYHRMGMIQQKLKELEVRDNTIIIFMSDNGHSTENGGVIRVENHSSGYPKGHYYSAHGGGGNTGKWRGSKGSFYEGGIRVPAIISYPPQLPQGVVRDQAITAAGWLPTVAELCDVTLPKVKLDGQSLLPINRSADTPTHHQVMHWQWNVQWAVREGPWKLIGSKDQKRWLGNLDDEQPEAENYLRAKPDIAQRLHELHDEWVSRLGRNM
jgi:arylsulfatase A